MRSVLQRALGFFPTWPRGACSCLRLVVATNSLAEDLHLLSRVHAWHTSTALRAVEVAARHGSTDICVHPIAPSAGKLFGIITLTRPSFARAAHAIFEDRGLLNSHGSARMQPSGGDADFSAEAEFAAVGELRRGVVQHDREVDPGEEFLRRRLVGGDDRIGMVGAVTVNMGDRLVDSVDHLRGDDGVLSVLQSASDAASLADRRAGSRRRRGPRSRRRSAFEPAAPEGPAPAALSTSRVSAAPHTPVRRIFELSTIDFAMVAIGGRVSERRG